jgi:hypothetical protein
VAEKTKQIEYFTFHYPNYRAESQDAFASNILVFDPEAGDVLAREGEGLYVLEKAGGEKIIVAPGWLWLERRTHTAKVRD